MSELTTDAGRPILHFHFSREGHIVDATDARLVCNNIGNLDKEKVQQINQTLLNRFPDIYCVAQPTYEYDCHGKTFGNKRCWINNEQVQKILEDDGYTQVKGVAKKGDIIIYQYKGAISHSGFIHQVDNTGKIIKIQSKWGLAGDYIHNPDSVPLEYGSWTVYRKRN